MQSSAQTGTLRVAMAFQYGHTRQKQLNYLIVLFEQLLLSDWTSILHYLSQCLLENRLSYSLTHSLNHTHTVLVFIKSGSPSGDLWSFIVRMMLIRWTLQQGGRQYWNRHPANQSHITKHTIITEATKTIKKNKYKSTPNEFLEIMSSLCGSLIVTNYNDASTTSNKY